ncbi:hypothetical protein GCM10010269_77230 [Streptomyces humidus]|uniref:Uncharacterized protein n=1 Tax=Streptomyces humidus TaxID=52259 RepID=A0A918GDK5_9ACTN|nr:hypothetical protein GCM10010269_77230 [Streptomyces humidus]
MAASPATRSISVPSATSSRQARPRPPWATMPDATASAAVASRSVTATQAPSDANSRAAAAPMPLPAPVISTAVPAMDRGACPAEYERVAVPGLLTEIGLL